MTPLVFMEALSRVLPPNVAVIEEAVTTTNTMFERLAALKNTTGYFGHRGWALGWGLGCAIGVKLAWPERPVLGVHRRWVAALRDSGAVDGGAISDSGHVCRAEQRPIPDSQGGRGQHGPSSGAAG